MLFFKKKKKLNSHTYGSRWCPDTQNILLLVAPLLPIHQDGIANPWINHERRDSTESLIIKINLCVHEIDGFIVIISHVWLCRLSRVLNSQNDNCNSKPKRYLLRATITRSIVISHGNIIAGFYFLAFLIKITIEKPIEDLNEFCLNVMSIDMLLN